MPYKSEKIRIAGTQYDRRIKLTPDQKEYIKWLREKQLISYSKLAKIFGVSKRLIQFICCPDKYLKNKESLKQRKAEGDTNLQKQNGQQQFVSTGDIRNNSKRKEI